MKIPTVLATINDLKAWKNREEKDNGFSKNTYRDAYTVLDRNYQTIIKALEGGYDL